MKRNRTIIAILLLFGLILGCQKQPDNEMKMLAISQELQSMVDQQQTLRENETTDPALMSKIEGEHRNRVFELLAQMQITTARDKIRAAIILQHTPAMMWDTKVTSRSVENYLLAHHLAKAAVADGYERGKRMCAISLDRYLMYRGQSQKFGTQIVYNNKTNTWTLYPIDPNTTDEERAQWNVEPLDTLKMNAEKANQQR